MKCKVKFIADMLHGGGMLALICQIRSNLVTRCDSLTQKPRETQHLAI